MIKKPVAFKKPHVAFSVLLLALFTFVGYQNCAPTYSAPDAAFASKTELQAGAAKILKATGAAETCGADCLKEEIRRSYDYSEIRCMHKYVPVGGSLPIEAEGADLLSALEAAQAKHRELALGGK